ncbi:protein flightless-1 [Adelges cooleyi]|uniref:protein flightless-1 n=1 Tax=Adelges cooleyi TaxID=133065 RepID=UPI00218063D7|nr:protein flightless-1 [Adelges cooleyi]XP_050429443.1 protein flightless-1 [Adelges cooleyi]XP_050429444.1 protein flightless-1 [Adelges cooleyi]
MANTGVLPFVRGIDFSNNDFEKCKFPCAVKSMSSVQWLNLNRVKLHEIPLEIGKLGKLEHLSIAHNNIEKLHGELTDLCSLRTLIARHNCIKSSGIPPELFCNNDSSTELTTLDLSHNRLTRIPEGLESSSCLLVLNLSHNRISSIPNQLFVHLTDLLSLDLSNNDLQTLPPQMRRLTNLQTLILNNNPLDHFQLRQLPSMKNLTMLHMRNTHRNLTNMPPSLESLTALTDLDLSCNQLPKVPDALYTLINLKRLNLSSNVITELSLALEVWQELEVLQLSDNELTSLPSSLCKLSNLKRLYINYNKLNFDGIPSGIGKLSALEVFSACGNILEMIPEGLCRCGNLKKLLLGSNKLITLPDTIHLLKDIEVLDLNNNPDLIMPPKPTSLATEGLQFYNIDFSLQNQLRLAGAVVPNSVQPTQTVNRDPIARKLRLRRSKRDHEEEKQAKILKGMQDIANDKNNESFNDSIKVESLKPKRWDESLEKPAVDYGELFEEGTGRLPGLSVWEIENFLPNMVDEVAHGKLYRGDCYIVLHTIINENSDNLYWKIYFWIGDNASLDKRACAAIHAVNLRNFLGAECRTIREELGEESDEFISLFDSPLVYIDGGRTTSGFYTVEDITYATRMFRVHAHGTSVHLEPVKLCYSSLDINYVFVLDSGLTIFLWQGPKAKNTLKSKARLLAEKINKNERKNTAEIILEEYGEESKAFRDLLEMDDDFNSATDVQAHVSDNFEPPRPRLYQVKLGMGYLELPQVEIFHNNLEHSLLSSKNVYILDCSIDLYVWFGKKSTRLVRAAAVKLSQELFSMIERPDFALTIRIQEGTEPQIFKIRFVGWEEVIAVDFTRTAESVQKTGADLTKWAMKQETKHDLAALFTPRQPSMLFTEAMQLMQDWNDDLDQMESFVLEGKKFVRLPEDELGHFYSKDCYVFLCRYWVPVDDEDGIDDTTDNQPEEDFQCVVYFWQGREASNMGWLTFTFSLEKQFKAMLGEKLEVVRTHQQQENIKFLSHFKRRFVIHSGKRKEKPSPVELYHLRSNGSALYSRLIEIKPDARNLNSAFCYIVRVQFDQEDTNGIVYLWIGSKADPEDIKLAEGIADEMFNDAWTSLQVLNEGEEPNNFFWVALGGEKPYECDADYMNYTRLFRCSNEKGYFTISEKCSDFCQDDLADDDIMILDNGEQVFMWIGARSSEVEIKLAYKSAQVYIQHLRAKQPEKPRKLMLALKNKESRRFTKCFHGWNVHKKTPE